MANEELIEKLKAGHPFEILLGGQWCSGAYFIGTTRDGDFVIEESNKYIRYLNPKFFRLKINKMWVQTYLRPNGTLGVTDPFSSKDEIVWPVNHGVLIGEPQEIKVPYEHKMPCRNGTVC